MSASCLDVELGGLSLCPTEPHPVKVTVYNDAGCPWGYSANPAFRVLEWRYGAQLDWRLV